MLNNLIILTSLFVSLSSLAMDNDNQGSNNNNSNVLQTLQDNANFSWDALFKLPFNRHGRINSNAEFAAMSECLIAPLWNAERAQGDIKALAEFIYFSLPAVNHRADCEQCLGNSYIHLLAASGNERLVQEVLQLWALSERPNKVDLRDIEGFYKQTPLHFIIGDEDKYPGRSKGNLQMLQLFLDHGASHLAKENSYELTPLGLALLSRRKQCGKMAEYLLTLEGSFGDDSVFQYLAVQYAEGSRLAKGTYPILEKHYGGHGAICERIQRDASYSGEVPSSDISETE